MNNFNNVSNRAYTLNLESTRDNADNVPLEMILSEIEDNAKCDDEAKSGTLPHDPEGGL
jgi:hypothetical protein